MRTAVVRAGMSALLTISLLAIAVRAPASSLDGELRVVGHRERLAHLGVVEPVADRALDLRDERLEEAVGVDEHERPRVEAELAERQHLGELLERAEATRQRDERVGALLERALARAH